MSGIRYIKAGSLIDGSGADVRRDIFLAVKDTIITAIGSTGDLPCNAAAAIDDFSHCTIVPALVDCSVSLVRSPSVDEKVRLSAEEAGPEKKAAMLEQHIRYCHTHGVLGVADSDDTAGMVKEYQERMAQKSIIDIRTSDRDFIKINYSANIEDEKSSFPGLDYDAFYRILKNRDKKKAVVVANGRQQVAEAIEAGCDAIEQGYGMGEDNLRKMTDKGVLWIPNVLRAKYALDSSGTDSSVGCRFSTRYVSEGKPVPGAEAFWKNMLDEQLAQLRLAGKLGVTTAVGTGAGSVGILHGESIVEEMKLFIKAGYSMVETIQCASENGAGFFDMEKLGKIAVGRKASFLITRGTPQQLPRKLAYLEGIYVDGAPSTAYCKNPFR